MLNELTPGGDIMDPGVGFSPVVDGEYIQDLPYVLYKQGRFHKEVEQVISGNLINETAATVPGANMPEKFPELVRKTIPNADDATIELIQSLYEYPPDKPEKLAWDYMSDMLFACNAHNIAKAYKCDAKRYVMSIPPAVHGQDVSCMASPPPPKKGQVRKQLTIPFLPDFFFYNQELTPVESIPIAREFQERLRRYITGAKNLEKYPDLDDWASYDRDETTYDITLDGFEVSQDPLEVNGRCEILNEIFADPKNGA